MKANGWRNVYSDLARELKNLWNMKVISIGFFALETVPKHLKRD